MTIASVDGLIAGWKSPQTLVKGLSGTLVTGRPQSCFYVPGIPGAAVVPTPGVAGAALTSYAGQLPFPAITGGLKRNLGRLVAGATLSGGTILLCDRLWHNSGLSVTLTTAQTVNSAALPARDVNAATLGEGVMLGMEVTGALGAGAPTLSASYTNPAGTAGKTAAGLQTVVASSIQGTFHMFGLAAGDTGIKSVESFTASATMTSGSISLVLYRILAAVQCPLPGVGGVLDPITGGMPEEFANSVLFPIFIPNATTSTGIFMTHTATEG